jgi:hypothetical protein
VDHDTNTETPRKKKETGRVDWACIRLIPPEDLVIAERDLGADELSDWHCQPLKTVMNEARTVYYVAKALEFLGNAPP